MFRIIFALVAIGGIAGLCLGFLGALHPAFDTAAQFRWHFALLLLMLSIIGLITKVKRAPFILMLFALIGVWQSGAGNRVGNLNPSELEATNIADPSAYSLMHLNLRFDNPFKDAVLNTILDINPDILMLNETSRQWQPKLEGLKATYPYVFHCPEWKAIGGGMIFSKFQLRQTKDYCHSYAALGVTEVKLGDQWVEIGIVHMRWPWPASGPKQLAALEPKLKTIGADAIIAGDFNAATWSYGVQHFANLAKLKITTGFGGTWMYKHLPMFLAPRLGLPIDNAMAKGRVKIIATKTLPAMGSDHLALLVNFQFAGK